MNVSLIHHISLSLDVLCIPPVTARQVLYWTFSILFWKLSLFDLPLHFWYFPHLPDCNPRLDGYILEAVVHGY